MFGYVNANWKELTQAQQERYAGVCSRSFYVGTAVRPEDISAKYEDGILKLSVPKAVKRELPETTSIAIL